MQRSPLPRLTVDSGQAHVGPDGQDSNSGVYISPKGGIRSRRMSQLTRYLLLWSLQQLKSLQATHIPGNLNHAANAPGYTPWGVETQSTVVFPDRDPPYHGHTGSQLAPEPAQVYASPQ